MGTALGVQYWYPLEYVVLYPARDCSTSSLLALEPCTERAKPLKRQDAFVASGHHGRQPRLGDRRPTLHSSEKCQADPPRAWTLGTRGNERPTESCRRSRGETVARRRRGGCAEGGGGDGAEDGPRGDAGSRVGDPALDFIAAVVRDEPVGGGGFLRRLWQ